MKDKLIALATLVKNLAASSPLNVLSMWVAWLFVALDEAQRERDMAEERWTAAALSARTWKRNCYDARAAVDSVYEIGWKAIVQRDERNHLLTMAIRQRDEQRSRADAVQDGRVTAEYACAAEKRRAEAAEKQLAELQAEMDADDAAPAPRYVPTSEEVKAWGEEFEAAAVYLPAPKLQVLTARCAACDEKPTPPRLIKDQDVIHVVCESCFRKPWCDVKEAIQARAALVPPARIESESPPCINVAPSSESQ